MYIEDYGRWTKIQYKDGRRESVEGHQNFSFVRKVDIEGYAHYTHGAMVEKFWSYRETLGWVVNEIIGLGIVNPRGVAVGKKCN